MSQEADSRDSVMQNKMSFCNFQRRRQRWSTNGDRRGTSVGRLNKDKLIQVGRFSSSKNFVCESDELVIYVFINF